MGWHKSGGACSCCPDTGTGEECFDGVDCIKLPATGTGSGIEDSELKMTIPASFADYPILGCRNCNEDAVGDFTLGNTGGGAVWRYHSPNWCSHFGWWFHLTLCFRLTCATIDTCTATAGITWVNNPISGWEGQSCFNLAGGGITYNYNAPRIGLDADSWSLDFDDYDYHLGGGAWPCDRDTQPDAISVELQ